MAAIGGKTGRLKYAGAIRVKWTSSSDKDYAPIVITGSGMLYAMPYYLNNCIQLNIDGYEGDIYPTLDVFSYSNEYKHISAFIPFANSIEISCIGNIGITAVFCFYYWLYQ